MQGDDGFVSLRAHHILCIHTFTGKGYSTGFVKNMQRVVDSSRSPSGTIKIIEGLDDVCVSCPHNDGRLCRKDRSKVDDMDDRALAALGVEAGVSYGATFLNLLVKKAVREGLYLDICKECEWFKPHCRAFFAGLMLME